MWEYFLVYSAGVLTGVWIFLLVVRSAMKMLGRRMKK